MTIASWSHRHPDLFCTFNTCTVWNWWVICSLGIGRNQKKSNHRSEGRKTATKLSSYQEKVLLPNLLILLGLPSILSSDHFCKICHLSFSTSMKKTAWSWQYQSVYTIMDHHFQQRIVGVRIKMIPVIKGILTLPLLAYGDLITFWTSILWFSNEIYWRRTGSVISIIGAPFWGAEIWRLTLNFCQVAEWHCSCTWATLGSACEVFSWPARHITKLVFLKRDHLSAWGEGLWRFFVWNRNDVGVSSACTLRNG